jgi:hypothetical protein
MKTSFFTILTAVTTVAAFAPLSPKHQRLARIFSQVDEETKLEKFSKEALEEGDERTGPIENALEREVVTSDAVNSPPGMSTAIPFLKRPEFLDGSMPGDVGFDPFGFVDSEASLVSFREAEIKHARLAMLVRIDTTNQRPSCLYAMSDVPHSLYPLFRLLLVGRCLSSLIANLHPGWIWIRPWMQPIAYQVF